ncbi:MAG TPA: trigger factor, partial [Candidatus Paceibacterota bacterium]|nr:trigger factor [Candidatus Paceibacterota bacterium]
MNTKGNTQKTSVTRDEERWEVEVAAEIPPESLHQHRESAVHELQKTTKMDGFRPGKVPREKIVEMYGEEAIMRRAAERAIQAEIPELFAKEGLFIIETPKVTIDAPLPGKGLSFKARAGLAPSIELPDYTAIAEEHRKKKEVPAVTDAEYEEALLHLRRERVRIDKMESGIDAQKAAEEARAFPTADLPALDESFAQSVGYESAEKFLQAVRSNMQKEKEMREAQMKRNVLLDDLVKHSTIHYPVVMREYEINDLEARLSEDLAQAGMSLDHYL